MVIHLLHERGALDIDDRVAKYIPEYAQHGKEETTIAHVLAHRAGVPTMPARRSTSIGSTTTSSCSDWSPRPSRWSGPGRLLAYHAISGGFVLGEIVAPRDRASRSGRCCTTRSSARSASAGATTAWRRRTSIEVGLGYATGPRLLPPVSTLVTRVARRADRPGRRDVERPAFPDRVVPSANVVTNANELSRFFEIFRAAASSTAFA